ncbi:MAG: TetR/AcrR family transcriptional regulator [Microbacterium sp.]|uniref:TetR/AcrR family transcriptional regulator n=1 Tax=Microbacterium sp. TaxID=51671 RepID=UPI001AC686B4|nr:TetR/AcrR family transcriptional regulator [Microbacterium sp.]MBN9178112.1 TetR/AcrR family transcriptional regulator [Microbacterium sp.]
MPKVTDEYRNARRGEIIEVAISQFAEHGYARTSIADLVTASGLSAGAIYGNFPGGKQELFVAAASRILKSRRDELAAGAGADRPLSPGEVMATLIRGIRAENVGSVLPQLWGEASIDAEIRTLVSAVFRDLRQTVADRLTEWAAAHPDRTGADPSAWGARMAPVVLSAAPGFVLQRAMLDDFDEVAYIDALPDIFVH